MNTLYRLYLLVILLSMAYYQPASALQTNPNSNNAQTIILVRHAEKSPNGGLTQQGKKRAKILAKMLTDTKIGKIYSTETLRTQQTVTPTAKAHFIPITLYDSNHGLLAELKREAIELSSDETILIVGHSNTIPELIYQLGGPSLTDIDESVFDNLYILQVNNITTTFLHLHYPKFSK